MDLSQGSPPDFEVIRIRGARAHNLKSVDVDIPRGRLVVITGPSGSGKSSLAFDTLYAEGQRQYLESLSTYARQFLDQLERADVDEVEGLQPTLCIDQRRPVQNPRSTVATVTEIYDYLRLLLARLGQVTCYRCGAAIQQQSPEQIQEALIGLPETTKMMILAPLVRGRRGQHKDVLAKIRKAGLVRVRIDGEIFDIDQTPELSPRKVHHIDAIVDRVIIRPGIRTRVGESILLALRFTEGVVGACYCEPDVAGSPWTDRIFSTEYACPECQISYAEIEPRTFSFNSPYGACDVCEGLGVICEFDAETIIQLEKSLDDGAVVAWKGITAAGRKKYAKDLEVFLEKKGLNRHEPLQAWKPALVEAFLHGDGKRFPGLLTLLEKERVTTTSHSRQQWLESFRGEVRCGQCNGSRLRPEANSIRIGDCTIHEICEKPISEASEFFQALKFDDQQSLISQPLIDEITKRLNFLTKVGVPYLTLSRSTETLSGGEFQRVRLATNIGSGLVGVCYVLDEPSIGLHPRDNQRLIDALRDLQQQGNTVLVVEHDEAIMRQADHLIDMGPEAGARGGFVVAEGTPTQLAENPASLTGQFLSGTQSIEVPRRRRKLARSRAITLANVTTNNLKDVTATFPLGGFICVTGVSGSGKSSLVNESLTRALVRRLGGVGPKPGAFRSLRGVSQIDKVVEVDQSPIGRSPRSNAATYTGAFDEIRKVFAQTRDAKQRGFRANRFSFNVKGGRCEECQGQGVQKIEMNFLPDLFVSCNSCEGARFNAATLAVIYKEKSIADVLEMSVSEALEFFENFDHLSRILRALQDVGLGYLPLGQPSTSISGGEAQRIKLASELSRVDTGKTFYVLDEPTTGLHLDDIRRLLHVLNQLVERGNTVLVIEHHLDVIKYADWVIDLGPEGGAGGGHILAAGPPEAIAQLPDNETGRYLHEVMS